MRFPRAKFRVYPLLVLLALLQGCGMFGQDGRFRDRKNDYVKATSGPPLVVPPGFDDRAIEDLYRVPPIAPGGQALEPGQVPRPPALLAGDADDLIKLQSVGAQQWVLVQLLPGQVWPLIKDFLITRRVGMAAVDTAAGVVDTGWLRPPDGKGSEMFRFQLVQGLQRSSAEVHVRQLARSADAAAGGAAPGAWPERSNDAEREQLMLQQFASYLANTADVSAPVSLAAQGIDVSPRLTLVSGRSPVLRLRLNPGRAWASLGAGLERAQFAVLAQDVDAGSYQVTLAEAGSAQKQSRWQRFTAKFGGSKGAGQDAAQFDVKLAPAAQAGWMEVRIGGLQTELAPARQEQLLTRIMTHLS